MYLVIIALTPFIPNNGIFGVMKLVAGCSPTIAVMILLKRFGQINHRFRLSEFVFDFPKKASHYLLLLMLIVWRTAAFCIFGDLSGLKPLYMIAPYFLMQLTVQGGLEEPGWRGFLQPFFEKKYNFILAALFVSLIWAIWHIPLWLIPNSTQSGMSFIIFYLQIIVNTLSLAAIYKVTKSIAFCMIYHAWLNTVFLMIPFQMNAGIVIAYAAEAVVSLAICLHVNKSDRLAGCVKEG